MNLILLASMRIVSVNVGRPRLVLWKGTQVSTGIFKDPVEGPVEVKKLNLAVDRWADLSVHGGPSTRIRFHRCGCGRLPRGASTNTFPSPIFHKKVAHVPPHLAK